MKKGVLACLGGGRLKNIGDYIQTLAARQFTGDDCVYVERERLNTYSGGPTKLIMNAWFMFHPDRFPPSPDIEPLFLAFHVRPVIEKRFFTERTVAYLKAHEPIGCRSTEAVELLERHGIRAEFSSCLTLTLGLSYRHAEPEGPPIFVDPRFRRLPEGGGRLATAFALVRFLVRIPFLLARWRSVRTLAAKFACFIYWPGIRHACVRWLYAAEFLRAYSTLFSDELLTGAEYVTHKVPRTEYPTEASLLACAETLLKRYARAPFVVTSRLHCTLPCLAIGTPCWTVLPPPEIDSGRFGGNDAFMNGIFMGANGRLVPPKGVRARDPVPPVREEFRPYAERLIRRCRAFMQEGPA